MPSKPPDGDPMPTDGSLPPAAADRLGAAPFGIYVHVPFCMTRCGYCDFNTYTATELGSGATRESYAALAVAEIKMAGSVLAGLPVRYKQCSSAAARRRCCRRPT